MEFPKPLEKSVDNDEFFNNAIHELHAIVSAPVTNTLPDSALVTNTLPDSVPVWQEIIDMLIKHTNRGERNKSTRHMITALRPHLAQFDDEKRTRIIQKMHEILANLPNLEDDKLMEKIRLLVLTDVGEETDDEAALWMLLKILFVNKNIEAHVVFCTGDLDKRRNRWCSIIRNELKAIKCSNRITYFKGTPTERLVRHGVPFMEKDVLEANGLHYVTEYDGGSYDVVIQMAPLGDSKTLLGALERVKLRDGAEVGSYVLVGSEGSTNFDKNSPIHDLFKAHLLANGFLMSCVAQENYATWTQSCIQKLPLELQNAISRDEWMKAIGRIDPRAVNLFVRGRLAFLVNYMIIRNGFAELENEFRNDALLRQTADWWTEIKDHVLEKIRAGYIQLSRDQDNLASFSYGPALMEDWIKGQDIQWMALVSPAAQSDFAPFVEASSEKILEKCHVDTVMSWALLLMTERMARTWAFVKMKTGGGVPDKDALNGYLEKSLAASHFPELPVGKNEAERTLILTIKLYFGGSPQYDPSGMGIAVVALSATPEQKRKMSQILSNKDSLINKDGRVKALLHAYEGCPLEDLLECVFPCAAEPEPEDEEDGIARSVTMPCALGLSKSG